MTFPDLRLNYPNAWDMFVKVMNIDAIEANRVFSKHADSWIYQDESIAYFLTTMGVHVGVPLTVEGGEYKYGYEIWFDHVKKWGDHNFDQRYKVWENAIPLCFSIIEKKVKYEEA